MPKRRGSPHFGKPHVPVPPASASAFDQVVQSLCLTPDEYPQSAALRAWVQQNKDHKYVPPSVLKVFGLNVGEDV